MDCSDLLNKLDEAEKNINKILTQLRGELVSYSMTLNVSTEERSNEVNQRQAHFVRLSVTIR